MHFQERNNLCNVYPNWVGDNFCDDDNNNEECAYDGGDCCGDHAGNMYWNFYCSVCECLDPNGESPTESQPPTNDGESTTVSPCGFPNWFGDNYCDDENNNEECGYDGGDCCGDNVYTFYCSVCQCLDPNGESPTGSAEPPTNACGLPNWVGDNYCDDLNNNEECGYDGGDCCGDNVNTFYCSVCQCLDPNGESPTEPPTEPPTTEPPTEPPTNECEQPQWFDDNYLI